MSTDPFKRMMEMEGVKPLNAPHVPQAPAARHQPSAPRPAYTAAAAPVVVNSDFAWAQGPSARQTLDTAMQRMVNEKRAGKNTWITGIKQDGSTSSLSTIIASPMLLSYADRMDLRMIIIGGDGWTFALHPQMGVATLDRDPV